MTIRKFPSYIYWIFLVVNLILSMLSIYFLSTGSISTGIYLFIAVVAVFSFLVFSDIKIISEISFFITLPISFIVLGAAGASVDGVLENAHSEKATMITLSLMSLFYIINCSYWIINKTGWRKIISIILLILFLFLSILFGLSAPEYYQNFVYTRLFILIFFGYGIFLTAKTKKFSRVLGILMIPLSICMVFLSTVFFAQRIYPIDGEEKEEIITNLGTKPLETLEYYNEKDIINFCKYCSEDLAETFEEDPSSIVNFRDSYGSYTQVGDVDIKRVAGFFYVQYPITFEGTDTQYYFILILTDTDSDIYGLYISETKY